MISCAVERSGQRNAALIRPRNTQSKNEICNRVTFYPFTDILLSFEHRGQNYFFFETVVKVVSSFCKDKKRGSIYLNTY